jgi:ATP-dependent Clp protease ATP-binding subunit ClpA
MDARVDEIVIFRRLSPEHIKGIVEMQLGGRASASPSRTAPLPIVGFPDWQVP